MNYRIWSIRIGLTNNFYQDRFLNKYDIFIKDEF